MRFDGGLYAHAGDVSTYPQVDEWRDEAKLLDEAGFTSVWIAEHHFFWDGWATPTPPNPILAGADLAAHTQRIRIGQCGVCLPDWHPIRVAEDIAMLDHLSNGRVDFGIIKGLNSRVNGNFNIHADRRNKARNTALFLESLDLVIKAWTEEAFTHHGEFYRFPMPGWKDVSTHTEDSRYYNSDGELIAMSVLPKPRQKPHPPIWQVVDGERSIQWAASNGINTIMWIPTVKALKKRFEIYKEAKSKAENREVPMGEGISLVRDMFVAETMEEAEKLAGEYIINYMRWVCHWRGLGNHMDPGENLPETKNKLDLLNYDFLHKRNLLFGTPDYVVSKIKELQSELNLQNLQVWSNFPGIDHEACMRSIKLFNDEVIPKINPDKSNIQKAS